MLLSRVARIWARLMTEDIPCAARTDSSARVGKCSDLLSSLVGGVNRFAMLNIIVVSKHLRAPKKLSLQDPRTVSLLALSAAFILALFVAIGFFIAHLNGSGIEQLKRLQAQVQAQAQDLELAKTESQREINAMAARIAQLQAQANRLNALGERLTQVGRLKDGEFNFSEAPGLGGPEISDEGDSVSLNVGLESVESKFAQAEYQLNVLQALLFDRDLDAAQTPAGMPAPGYISSGYGTRSDPFSGGRGHQLGIDIDANTNDPVVAAADGVVSFSGIRTGYGNVVEVDHGNGYKTLYAHNRANLVQVGDLVRAGDQIAKVGSTGRSTGSHLHFEVILNGRKVNPRQYLDKVRD